MKIASILISLCFATTHASDDNVDERVLHGGWWGNGWGGGKRRGYGGMRGSHPHEGFEFQEPTDVIECPQPEVCDLYDRFNHDLVVNGGIRICRQSFKYADHNHTICVNATAPIMGYATDVCGCCGGPCPTTPCNTCPCEGYDRDGTLLYTGYELEMPRRGRYGGAYTKTICVAEDNTIDAQARGATCKTVCT